MVLLPAHVSFLFIYSWFYLAHSLFRTSASLQDLRGLGLCTGCEDLFLLSHFTDHSGCQWLCLSGSIRGLHTDPASPETLRCQALSCPGLTYYILFCNHKCDLKIGVFAYLYVWMWYLVATSTWAYSSFRGLVLLFVSQKPLPCRFSEKCLCVAG